MHGVTFEFFGRLVLYSGILFTSSSEREEMESKCGIFMSIGDRIKDESCSP